MDKFSLRNSNETGGTVQPAKNIKGLQPLDTSSINNKDEANLNGFNLREVQRPKFMEKPINNFSSGNNRKRIIAVSSSGKGGTGKSTTSLMFGLFYQQLNRNTVLVDMDIPFGDISTMLGMSKDRCISDFEEIPEDLSDEKVRENMLLTYHNGLKVLPALRDLFDQRKVNSAKFVDKLLKKLDSFETIIIDLGPNFEELTIRVLEEATDIVYVTDDYETTFHNIFQGKQTLARLGIDVSKVRLVINKSVAKDERDENIRATNAMNITSINKVHFFPFVLEMPQLVDNSCYLVLDDPKHPYRHAVLNVIEDISPELFTAKNAELVDSVTTAKPKRGGGFLARLFGGRS